MNGAQALHVLTCMFALQTLMHLHGRAHIAHLDISNRNVMVLEDDSRLFDYIRLINFGMAEDIAGNCTRLSMEILELDCQPIVFR